MEFVFSERSGLLPFKNSSRHLMKIAVQGCCHGELDNIYASIQFADEKSNCKTDLLIICGDFQALRNTFDEQQMACPPKFRRLGGFHEYYSGAKLAPIKTMFVGGNHEASNYLWELYHGGFVAANIYFMGFAGIVTFAGLRIAGLSGIYNPQNYHSGHHETPPYTDSQIRSIYHVRKFEIAKLMLVSDPIDIFISHDWPAGIANYGDKASLLQKKKFLRSDIESNSLGSPPAMALLSKIKPKFWFAAHMHVKFSAIVNHGPTQTKFLALDKCLPNRDFLQFLDIPTPNHQGLSEIAMDPEWLSIVKSTNHHMSLTRIQHIPSQEDLSRYAFSLI